MTTNELFDCIGSQQQTDSYIVGFGKLILISIRSNHDALLVVVVIFQGHMMTTCMPSDPL